MTDYVIMRTTNWWALFEIIGALIMGIVSLAGMVLIYEPIFLFYMPSFRDSVGIILFFQFIVWLYAFIHKAITYKSKEKHLIIRKGKM